MLYAVYLKREKKQTNKICIKKYLTMIPYIPNRMANGLFDNPDVDLKVIFLFLFINSEIIVMK